MAASPDEVGFWTKLAVGAAGVASTLAGLVWKDAQRRVEKAEAGISKLDREKADKSTVETQRKETRETFITVFEKIDDLKNTMNNQHQRILEAINNATIERRRTPRG